MSIFSRDLVKKAPIVIFDIGSTSVGGALVDIGDGHKSIPTLIWAERRYVPLGEHLNSDRLVSSIKKVTKEIAEHMAKHTTKHPLRVYCVLSSPWYVSQTREAKFDSLKPVLVTKKLVDQIVKKEAGLVMEAEERKYGYSGVEIIEKNNMEIKLNGYATNAPYGKNAEELSVFLYTSVGQVDFNDAITQIMGNIFHAEDVEFHTLSFLSFGVIRDMFPQKEDFMLCDVSGEVTDISIIQDNILLETVSVPLGKNFLIRGVMKALSVEKEEALSLIRLFAEDRLNETTFSRLKKILDKIEDEWMGSVNNALSGLSRYAPFPNDLFLTAGPEAVSWFARVLSKKSENQNMAEKGLSFSVISVNATLLRQLVDFKGVVARDPFLMLEAVFVDKLLNLQNS